MRILIGYDGSGSADGALDDLKHAGLDPEARALVMSVADVFVPPPMEEPVEKDMPTYLPDSIKRAHARALQKLEQTTQLAARAS